MATKPTITFTREEVKEEDTSIQPTPASGSSRFSRVDQSIEDRIKWQEERKLNRSNKGQAGGNGLRRSRLNPVSKKQKKKQSGYKEAREIFYDSEKNQKCFLCGRTDSLSIHHKKKRGNDIDDPLYFVSLCLVGDFMDRKYPDSNHSHSGGCHSWVEANKSIARELKLIL